MFGKAKKECRGWPRHITLFLARSRLYRNEIVQPNTHFAAFFKTYKITGIPFLIFVVFSNLSHRFHNFCCNFANRRAAGFQGGPSAWSSSRGFSRRSSGGVEYAPRSAADTHFCYASRDTWSISDRFSIQSYPCIFHTVSEFSRKRWRGAGGGKT